MNNPFDWGLRVTKNAEKDVLGAKLTQVGSKGTGSTSSTVLCDSKQEVWIYTVDYDEDNKVTAGTDNIVVSFVGTDTSGLGCIGEWLNNAVETTGEVVLGSIKFVTDPVDWYTTVTGGFGGALAQEGSPIGQGSTIGDAAVSSGFAQGYVDLVDDAGEAFCGKYNPFCAEEYRADPDTGAECIDDIWGTLYHNSNGSSHKIRVTITCDGQQVYQTDMAGGTKKKLSGDTLLFEPITKMFKITRPGTWKVTTKTLGSSSDCATPNLNKSWTINVPKPDGWDEFSRDMGEVPAQVSELTQDVQAGFASAGIQTEVDPLKVLTGIVVAGGLLTYMFLS